MKKRGFTLVELMGVIVIIALISIIVSPLIMNQVASKKENVSSIFKNIVLNATKEYMNGYPNGYKKDDVNGTTYCVGLVNLVDAGLLELPLNDPVTGESVNINRYVKMKLVRIADGGIGEFVPVEDSVIIGSNCEGITYNRVLQNYPYDSDEPYLYSVNQTGFYKIELWGASGGDVNKAYLGGRGGYTSGIIKLNDGDKIYIYVGAAGVVDYSAVDGNHDIGHGGGATDIRYFGSGTPSAATLMRDSTDGLKARIMVAGGGGGSYYHHYGQYFGSGGFGGGLTGGQGTGIVKLATPGNQTSGGLGSSNGTFGFGGQSLNQGGDGYYGGGGNDGDVGDYGISGSAGGSSFISGYTGCVAVTSSGTPKSSCQTETDDIECSIHYSNKVFIGNTDDLKMLSGDKEMYSPTGSIEVGHYGDGFARITFVGIDYLK